MPHGSHERPARRPTWKVATPVAVTLCGILFGVSAAQSEGRDLRGGRLTDLASVVQAESERTSALTEKVAALNADIEELSSGLGDRSVTRVQRQVRTLSDPAGLTPVTGQAVQVTLDDASLEVRQAAMEADDELTANDFVVHQQDIQAVANALWRAGAEAVTIQGQRLVSTTGIKCEGNSVTLHGVPYGPPYVIVGVGDTTKMFGELEADPILQEYRTWAFAPGGGVTWETEFLGEVTAPAYEGLTDLSWAKPIEG
ncbi:MAG: DUF881 domain-containing protein [Nocardioides sp.]|uniref:DUF881 domain-containing protein n=1 Tax=Nocardioides sp. TaxID=35761 RepID=UPI003F0FA693